MTRTALFFLVLALSIAGGAKAADRNSPEAAHKSDRLPKAAQTSSDYKVNFALPYMGSEGVPPDFAAAMTWYRAASKDESAQSRALAFNWNERENLPEFLQWTWAAPNGDLVTRVGKGLFRLSFGNYRVNWFWEIGCRLVSWPSTTTEAVTVCDDGKERKMLIPGDGTVVIDDIQYRRVFPIDEAPLADETQQIDEALPEREVEQDGEAPVVEE